MLNRPMGRGKYALIFRGKARVMCLCHEKEAQHPEEKKPKEKENLLVTNGKEGKRSREVVSRRERTLRGGKGT